MVDRVMPPTIPGEAIDPPPRDETSTLAKIDDRSRVVGVGYRAFLRFSMARASLLAAGTAYYVFLALFALIAMAFGVAFLLGSQWLTSTVNHALTTAFPRLVGDGGLDGESLRSIGSSASIVGLLVLLYSGSGAMSALNSSLHLLYGAPKDPRNYVLLKARLIGWLVLIAPLMLLSFAPSVVVTSFAKPVLDAVGLPEELGRVMLLVLSIALSLAVSFLVLWLVFGRFGGVRPARRPRLIGAAVGAVFIELLKYAMANIVAWSLSKPQYGAFAAPIAILFVLYLLCVVTYAAASLTAALAETDEPQPS